MRPLFYIKITGLAVLVFFSLLTGACKKLIGTPPNIPSQINQAQVFADSADVMSAVAGVYDNFKVTYGSTSFMNCAIPIYTGLAGDELHLNAANLTADAEFYADAITARNSDILNMWNPPYNALYQVNVCLENIAATTGIKPAMRQQLLGELKVVRALYYFNMVNLFGAVPLITTSNYQVNAVMPRMPVDSVYGQILADLNDALTLLTPAYPSAGRARPNLYTAKALLARVYLYRKQWAQAEAMASDVIGSGIYSLETDLNKVFLSGSNEAIWQLPAAGLSYQTSAALAFVDQYPTTIIPTYSLSAFLLSAFAPGDQRLAKWTGISTVNGVTYYFSYKYKNTSYTAAPQEAYNVFRLGEQYLIRGEARAQQSNLNGALEDWNAIHQRAGLPAGTAASATDALDSIMAERRTELFCEWGDRWYDLKRWGATDAVLGAEKPGWQSYIALWPVPYSELMLNPFLVQNPGKY